ncbi:MAG TPA: metallopeptidase family protein [Thermoleophilaceae bacterium]|jgi:predicted Zn-dependent protease with MMP-like domain
MLDQLRPILRAAAIAAFTVGTLLLLINPPSLSGAGGLLAIVVAATALILLGAWATVSLIGRDAMPEAEVERLVRRSEELSRRPPPEREPTEFDVMVAEEIDALPSEFQQLLETVPVVVSHLGRELRAYGHHFGGPFTRGDYEHRIVLYQDTLERDFGHDPALLRAQVQRTLRHEVAHHIGWGERGVRGLGL